MKKIRLKIDNKSIEASEGQTIFNTAQENGISIPHMCFDPRLEPFTSCWLCVVEVKGFPRLVPSCTSKVAEGMEVFTQSERVISARKTCLALLLSDHYGDCIAPCQLACPDHIDIQGYLALIALGQYKEALELIREVNPLPLCVGRVCPRFCEKECRRNLVDEPVGINFLKRFASENAYDHIDPSKSVPQDTGFRVAVIGSGPSGLSAAHFLRLMGHEVNIFEATPQPGGMMRYGIPEYRLPKKEMDKEIGLISGMGVKIEYGKRLGKEIDIKGLQTQGFQAILLAIGAWAERRLGCEGEDLDGVESGIGLLYKIASGEKVHIGKKVSVIGGGNTAIDAARSCLRMGASEVHLIYRRSREEMPANDEEVHEAEHEGVKLHFLSAPVKVEGNNGKVSSIRCIRMELGEPDSSGRRRPVPIEGSEFEFETDMVIAAIGQIIGDQDILKKMGIELTRRGTIAVDEKTKQTNLKGVFASGDCVLGPATVIEAIAGGRYAASAIDSFLRDGNLKTNSEGESYNHSKGDLITILKEPFESYEKIPRSKMPAIPKAERLKDFREVELGLSEDTAKKEALRCLSCGCEAVFDCKLREYSSDYEIKPADLMKGKYNLFKEREEHPFIFRDRNKCIRCGLCVRMCAEIEGASAYGFIRRGFNAIVDPPLDLTLKESTCDSCSLCLSTCPTGALEFRPRITKPGPWMPKKTETICTLCGIGCQIVVKTKAGHCLEVEPKLNGSINQGKLCWRGTFGWEMIHSPKRTKKPAKWQNDKIVHMGWDGAFKEAGNALKALINEHGPQSLAFLTSPRQTTEEVFLIENLAKTLGIENIYRPGGSSAANHINALGKGTDYKALSESDYILCLGSGIVPDFPVVSYMIKAAVKKGETRLAIIGPESERLTDISGVWIDCDQNEQGFILSILSAMAADQGLIQSPHYTKGKKIQPVSSKDMEKVEKSLRKGDVRDLLNYLFKANRPLIVVNEGIISRDTITLLLEGIWGDAVRFLPLNMYSQDCFNKFLSMDYLEDNIKSDKVKGILAFGHWKGLERIRKAYPRTLIVQSSVFQSQNGYHPDFLFPGSLPIESKGSFINAEGRLQGISEVLPPTGGKRNWELILNLAHSMGHPLPYKGIDEIQQAMSNTISHFQGAEKGKTPETVRTIQYLVNNTKKMGKISPDWTMDEIDLFLKDEIKDLIII